MALGVSKYDHPQFTVIRESRVNAVQGPAEEVTFAHFRSRNKCLMRFCHIVCTSNPSATTASIHVVRSGVTIASKTATHVSANFSMLITLTTLNTLHTITEVAGVEQSGAAGLGKWDVLWEYQILPPYTHVGS